MDCKANQWIKQIKYIKKVFKAKPSDQKLKKIQQSLTSE